MKADWDKLGDAYADSESVMIVDVDCTADGQQTCQKHGVKGYPTLQYFMAGKSKGSAYQGGRDFNSLSKFVKSKLDKPTKCNPETGKGCADIELKYIEANKGKSVAELDETLAAKKTEKMDLKQQIRDFKKEHKLKMKEFKKQEKKVEMAMHILTSLKKNAPSNHDEL